MPGATGEERFPIVALAPLRGAGEMILHAREAGFEEAGGVGSVQRLVRFENDRLTEGEQDFREAFLPENVLNRERHEGGALHVAR